MDPTTSMAQRRPAGVTADALRAAVRYPCGDGRWKALPAAGAGDAPVRVAGFTAGELYLDVNRPFRLGVLLSVDLYQPGGGCLRKLVRVTQVGPEEAGRWVHRCLFEVPLRPEELR
jgi:hypothetical protein